MSFKPRYIKAQEAEERIVALWRKEKGAYADTFNTAIDACQTIILDMYDNSSQDVVPVVRRKDCVYCKRFNDVWYLPKREELLYTLHVETYHTTENDFCSWGERKEDEIEMLPTQMSGGGER